MSRGIKTRLFIPFTLPDALIKELRTYAKSKDKRMSRIVEDALREYLATHP